MNPVEIGHFNAGRETDHEPQVAHQIGQEFGLKTNGLLTMDIEKAT